MPTHLGNVAAEARVRRAAARARERALDYVNEAAACGAPGPSARATMRPSRRRTAASVASLTAVTPAAAVRPGGGLVVDFSAAAESVLPGFTGEDRTMNVGDISVAATTEYDVAHSRLVSGYRFSRGAEEVAVTALHHVLTCAQIDDLLTTVGFVDIALYAGPDGEPFRLGSPRLLLTARRR